MTGRERGGGRRALFWLLPIRPTSLHRVHQRDAFVVEPPPTSSFRMCAPVFAANNIFLLAPPRHPFLGPVFPSRYQEIAFILTLARAILQGGQRVPTLFPLDALAYFFLFFLSSYFNLLTPLSRPLPRRIPPFSYLVVSRYR